MPNYETFEKWWASQSLGLQNPASKASAKRGWDACLTHCANTALSVDSKRGNERIIAETLQREARAL